MTIWPSIASRADGQMLGRVYSMGGLEGVLPFNLSVGKLVALASAPLVAPLYLFTKMPRLPFVVGFWPNPWCVRYRVTNRRILVEQPFGGGEQKSVSLDHFDSIQIEVLPGQQWYDAGDLIFYNGNVETFRLTGVSRPEAFRQVCQKARQTFVGVAQARELGFAV